MTTTAERWARLLLLAGPLWLAPACEPESAPSAEAAAAAERLSDPEARELLDALSGASAREAREALTRIRAARDERFVAVFVELLRAAEIGIADPKVREESVLALEELSGEAYGDSWPEWVEWYAGTELAPPPGFTGWKGRLLGRIDPEFEAILYDDAPATIRVEEVVWGGVPYEGIPALDQPRSLRPEEADYLGAEEPVFGIALGGEARAYPLRILDWHEMANDEVGGVAFSLAYCTLCGAGIAYAARASNGEDYDFGSSGFLLRSNKLMVDRQTRTLWNQLTGRPVLGPLAESDLRLDRLPVVVTTWGAWRERHPETRVLSLDTGHRRPYLPGAAYAGYFASPQTMFPVWQRSRLLPAKERIYGLELDGLPKAYPLEALIRAGVVHDEIAGAELVLLAPRESIQVDGESVRSGPARYEAGAPVRAYRSAGHRFRPGPEAEALIDERGRSWRVTEAALLAPDGERAERLNGFLAYWFGWNAYHPKSLVYQQRATP